MKQYITVQGAALLLDREPELRPRIYGELTTGESAGQIVRLPSLQRLDQYAADLGPIWVSDTTIADIIGRA